MEPQGFSVPGTLVLLWHFGSSQIANAVPSLLAEVVARAIGEQFFGMPLPDRLTFTVDPRRPIPPPERLRLVGKKYLNLKGEHAEHPGTGKEYAGMVWARIELRGGW